MNRYASFVKKYHEKHPKLKGKDLFKKAASMYMKQKRKRNPSIEAGPDDVVFVIPAEVLEDMQEGGGHYEGVPMENPGFFTDSHGVVHPMRDSYEGKKSWGGAYSSIIGRDYESRRELDVGRRGRRHVRTGERRGGRRRRNPTAACPACHNPVHIPSGAISGTCPHCGRRLKVS